MEEQIKENTKKFEEVIEFWKSKYFEESRKLEKTISELCYIRNLVKDCVICKSEEGTLAPAKNLSKQEVYERFLNINLELKGNYVFLSNERFIEELLNESEVKTNDEQAN